MCETKSCSKCKEVKPLADFSRNRTRKDGRSGDCKLCAAEYAHAYQQANKTKLLEHAAKYKKDNWESVSAANAAYYARNKIEILEKMAAYTQANPGLIARKNADYYVRNKASISARSAEYYRTYPERTRAHNAVSAAIKSGQLRPAEACETCGSAKYLEYHHPDYSKPLEVIPLCRSCHKLLHTGVRQLPDHWIERGN